jgi:hypothetical protein
MTKEANPADKDHNKERGKMVYGTKTVVRLCHTEYQTKSSGKTSKASTAPWVTKMNQEHKAA